jgi:SWI/SNF-related matrix-associated actin-dependent regulator of chromatin subfamily A3
LKICKPLDQVSSHGRPQAHFQAEYFKSLLLRPLKNGAPEAGKLLQALVGQSLLRRTKDSRDASGRLLVTLPPIEHFQVPVALDEATRGLYDEMYAVSRERFQKALLSGEGVRHGDLIKVADC